MDEPFIGEIRPFAFGFAPSGWLPCEGQLLSVSKYSTLFTVVGTRFGGDGHTSFALPDLRGAAPVMAGHGPGLTDRPLGSVGGEAEVTLATDQIASHSHEIATTPLPANSGPAQDALVARASAPAYTDVAPDVAMAADALDANGGGAPHENRQPFLVIGFYIALVGDYPG
ncbi:MAG: tail fiber protein [Pseudomonadota bacterium]